MTHPLVEYFRCPEHLAVLETADPLPADEGYFRFATPFATGGRAWGLRRRPRSGNLVEASSGVESTQAKVLLPFDLSEVIENLRQERYPEARRHCPVSSRSLTREIYYLLRPILPVGGRKYFQRIPLRGWGNIAFPRWPVDSTVEKLMRHAARALMLQRREIAELPFIWFWPDGPRPAPMMTHDVEDPPASTFCDQLMDIDDSFGIKSAFQLIPEGRDEQVAAHLVDAVASGAASKSTSTISTMTGACSSTGTQFQRARQAINRYAREFGSRRFRSGRDVSRAGLVRRTRLLVRHVGAERRRISNRSAAAAAR